jgi:hypothetical protein
MCSGTSALFLVLFFAVCLFRLNTGSDGKETFELTINTRERYINPSIELSALDVLVGGDI